MFYDILYKTLIGAKSLRIRLDKVNASIRVHDETRYLVLFDPEKYDAIYNRVRYLTSLKSGTTYVISHKFVSIKIYSYDALPLEKTPTLHNVIILTESVFNKGQNKNYHNTF